MTNRLIQLTHICVVDFPILINWTSPFPILGVSGELFHLYSILNRYSCKQTVKTLITCRVLRRLIWICTVWLCPKKWDARLIWVNKDGKVHWANTLDHHKFLDRQVWANSVDPDRGAVWSGSTLFAILSTSFRPITLKYSNTVPILEQLKQFFWVSEFSGFLR